MAIWTEEMAICEMKLGKNRAEEMAIWTEEMAIWTEEMAIWTVQMAMEFLWFEKKRSEQKSFEEMAHKSEQKKWRFEQKSLPNMSFAS